MHPQLIGEPTILADIPIPLISEQVGELLRRALHCDERQMQRDQTEVRPRSDRDQTEIKDRGSKETGADHAEIRMRLEGDHIEIRSNGKASKSKS